MYRGMLCNAVITQAKVEISRSEHIQEDVDILVKNVLDIRPRKGNKIRIQM